MIASEKVYLGLLQDIHRGVLRPGARLAETVVAKQFAVSRTPVREALRRLVQDGVVESTSYGWRVTQLSLQVVNHIYPIITALEALAAREAARQASVAFIEQLQRLNEEMQSASNKNDVNMFEKLNAQFHDAIIDASCNPVLKETISRFRTIMRYYRHLVLCLPGRMGDSVQEHNTIIAACQTKDDDEASAAMERHIKHAWRILAIMFSAAENIADNNNQRLQC